MFPPILPYPVASVRARAALYERADLACEACGRRARLTTELAAGVSLCAGRRISSGQLGVLCRECWEDDGSPAPLLWYRRWEAGRGKR